MWGGNKALIVGLEEHVALRLRDVADHRLADMDTQVASYEDPYTIR